MKGIFVVSIVTSISISAVPDAVVDAANAPGPKTMENSERGKVVESITGNWKCGNAKSVAIPRGVAKWASVWCDKNMRLVSCACSSGSDAVFVNQI